LGIGTKLTLQFLIVVALMAATSVLSGVIVDFQSSRATAGSRALEAAKKFIDDTKLIISANTGLAQTMSQDPILIAALGKHDPHGGGEQVKSIAEKTNYPGDLALIDSSGKLLYSTDNPKGGDPDPSDLLDKALKSGRSGNAMPVPGFAPLNAGRLMLISFVPVRSGGKFVGLIAASQPLSSQFLTGLSSKWTIENPEFHDLGIAVVPSPSKGPKDGQVDVMTTPNLTPGQNNKFLAQVSTKGVSSLPKSPLNISGPLLYLIPFTVSSSDFSVEGRWWHAEYLQITNQQSEGVILFAAPIDDIRIHAAAMVAVAILLGTAVALLAIIMARSTGRGITKPMRIITYRVAAIKEQKRALPPLEGLEGEWLELGEQIDTALSAMRSSLQSVRTQLNKQAEAFEDSARANQESTMQLENLNRQISQQARQSTELSKQVNTANRQTIFLQRKFEAVMQVSTEGFLILDQYGNVLGANLTFLNWIGASEGEIAGRLCFDLIKKPGEARSDMRHGQAFAIHGGDPAELINQFYPEGIVYNLQKDSAVEVLAHLQPIEGEDGSTQGYIMVLRDKSLRSEISHLRTEIVAMLADSIRTPLIQAESGWQTVLNHSRTLPPPVTDSLTALHEHYVNLLGVTDSLLMIYSNFVPPMPQMQPRQEVVVNRLVADCLEEVAPIARDRQLALDYKSVTGLPNLNVDKEILQGIIIQLLEKMISITGAGGRVRVESVYKGQEMRIGVLSSGPALPESELGDMFVGFIDGKHSMDTYSSRLAMYLARNSVERLGGAIWAESDRGTAIYFTVPIG
jgi:signal transduction histidine kinase